jgi:two-component system, cell cycle response regulator
LSLGHVLVVDDSDTTRTLLVRILQGAGFEVAAARDGVEGAALALHRPPAVVVTDLDMPVMDGHQLLRLLKSEPATAATPVVILTSHGEAPSRFWGAQIGADAYLTKDCEPDELVSTVRHLASLRSAPDGRPAADAGGSAAPPGPLDILSRVVRHLDGSLLHATLVNSLLEKGLRAKDLHSACAAILEVVGGVTDAHLMAVGVSEPEGATLHVQLMQPVSLAAARRAVDSVLATMGVPSDVSPDVFFDGTKEGTGDADPALLVSFPLPLRNASGRLAVLPIVPNRFVAESSRLLDALAPHAALVLDNARLAQRLQEMSNHDGLTRALNHRAIHERLQEELDRAQRYGHTVTVIIGDLDLFKRVNDTHGHLAGDVVLRGAAAAMGRVLRTSDTLGRYGGEEFLAVLPETDLEAGRQVAERLRRAVAERPAVLSSGEQVGITVSFGVACRSELPARANADALVGLADARLYAAKAAGRNCVRP